MNHSHATSAANPKRRVKWYRSPLPREQLSKLNKRSDFKGFLQAGGYLGLIVATAAASIYSFYHWPWYVTVLITYVHGMLCPFTINAVHELVHDSVFKTRWLNRFFARIFSFIGWHAPLHFWVGHTEHHKFTLYRPEDLQIDYLPTKPDVMKSMLEWAIINPRWIYRGIGFHLRRARWKIPENDTATRIMFPDSDPKRQWQTRRWEWILLLGHGAIITVSLIMGWWMVPIVVSLTPMYGAWLFFLCNNTQHLGLPEHDPDFRICCRTITLNPFLRFLYWHMNYHTEHHMYAAVPCYNLGKLHQLIKADLPHCPHGLIETWQQVNMIYKERKTNPDYQYVPDLPSPSPSPLVGSNQSVKNDGELKESQTPGSALSVDEKLHDEEASPWVSTTAA